MILLLVFEFYNKNTHFFFWGGGELFVYKCLNVYCFLYPFMDDILFHKILITTRMCYCPPPHPTLLMFSIPKLHIESQYLQFNKQRQTDRQITGDTKCLSRGLMAWCHQPIFKQAALLVTNVGWTASQGGEKTTNPN